MSVNCVHKLLRGSQSAREIQALICANKNYPVALLATKRCVNTHIRLWIQEESQQTPGGMQRLPLSDSPLMKARLLIFIGYNGWTRACCSSCVRRACISWLLSFVYLYTRVSDIGKEDRCQPWIVAYCPRGGKPCPPSCPFAHTRCNFQHSNWRTSHDRLGTSD